MSSHAEPRPFRLGTKTETARRRRCRFGVGDCDKQIAARSWIALLCYSSRIFPSVYKARAAFSRLKIDGIRHHTSTGW
jgi:hypothetical protein